MRFDRLRITNIGPFYGNYDFDLSSTGFNDSVILFGGKNGAGKTTILETVRIALFGPLAYGLKTQSDSYFEKIEAKLNNQAKRNGESLFRVMLDVTVVENLERVGYSIKRSWKRSKSTLKEEVTVQRNDRFLSETELDIFQERLREENPPQLFDLFLFDGEKVSQVLTKDTLPLYLKSTARVLFNLDLFEDMETDLETYLKQEDISKSLSSDEQLLQEYTQVYRDLQSTTEKLVLEQSAVQEELQSKRAYLGQVSKEFELYGGLVKEKRDSLLEELHDIEQERRAMMDNTKGFITELLPFYLARNLLEKVCLQMEDEQSSEIRTSIESILTVDSFVTALKSLTMDNLLSFLQPVEKVAAQVRDTWFSEVLPKAESLVIHRASRAQQAEISNVYRKVCEVDPRQVVNSFKKNTEMIERVHVIRNQIDADNTDEMKALLNVIHRTKNELESLELRERQVQMDIENTDEQTQTEHLKIQKLKEQIIDTRKSMNVYAVVNRIMDVSSQFRKLQMRKKLQEVEIETVKMLQHLFRKDLFVVRVSINPQTFDMKLYNKLNEEIDKEVLSAGEKQILLLSTVWAMISSSKRKIPFVFDTLLGRLDQTHKKSVITNFIPRCGEQVIILSTDSEVDEDHFDLLKPVLSRVYTIENDKTNTTVEVKCNDYFGMQYAAVEG